MQNHYLFKQILNSLIHKIKKSDAEYWSDKTCYTKTIKFIWDLVDYSMFGYHDLPNVF